MLHSSGGNRSPFLTNSPSLLFDILVQTISWVVSPVIFLPLTMMVVVVLWCWSPLSLITDIVGIDRALLTIPCMVSSRLLLKNLVSRVSFGYYPVSRPPALIFFIWYL